MLSLKICRRPRGIAAEAAWIQRGRTQFGCNRLNPRNIYLIVESAFEISLQHASLTILIECFLNSLDLFRVCFFETVHRKHLEKKGRFNKS